MGGGFPAAAFGGRSGLMDLLARPARCIKQARCPKTLVATTAGLATLRLADDDVYAWWARLPMTIGELAAKALIAEGVEHRVQHAGNLLSLFFVDPEVPWWTSTGRAERTRQDSRRSSTRCSPTAWSAALGVRGLVRVGAHDAAVLERSGRGTARRSSGGGSTRTVPR